MPSEDLEMVQATRKDIVEEFLGPIAELLKKPGTIYEMTLTARKEALVSSHFVCFRGSPRSNNFAAIN